MVKTGSMARLQLQRSLLDLTSRQRWWVCFARSTPSGNAAVYHMKCGKITTWSACWVMRALIGIRQHASLLPGELTGGDQGRQPPKYLPLKYLPLPARRPCLAPVWLHSQTD